MQIKFYWYILDNLSTIFSESEIGFEMVNDFFQFYFYRFYRITIF